MIMLIFIQLKENAVRKDDEENAVKGKTVEKDNEERAVKENAVENEDNDRADLFTKPEVIIEGNDKNGVDQFIENLLTTSGIYECTLCQSFIM